MAISHDADGESFSSDSWDGDDAMASYPDPGDEDTDVEAFRSNFTFAPPADSEAAENKSAYKGPIRASHEGAINENALEAVIAAINGARGGFDGVGQDALKSAYNTTVSLAVEADVYDDEDGAPEFESAAGGDGGQDDDSEGDSPGGEIEASFSGRIDAAGSPSGTADTDALTGVIWAAGTHTLYYRGEPTTVHVPEETIEPTFERLQKRVAARDASIGFDHPDDNSVAATTAVGDLGDMTGVALSADGRQIVLTDSKLTNNKAKQALASGSFDGYDYSIVGNIGLASHADGSPQTTNDGALEVAAVEIERTDLVRDGAVASAGVGAMPQVAASAARLATADPGRPATTFTATLEAAAGNITDMYDNDDGVPDDDPENLEAAQAVLDDARDVIEAKDAQISDLEDDLEAQEVEADAFGEIAAAHGLDPSDEDVEPRDVIDEHTEELRTEIAELEAGSPKYETGGDDAPDVEERTEDLRGKEVATLEAMAGTLAREHLDAQRERDQRSGAVAAGSAGGFDGGYGGGAGGDLSDEETDQLIADTLGASDTLEVQASDASPSEFAAEKYGIEPSAHDSEESVRKALIEAKSGGEA